MKFLSGIFLVILSLFTVKSEPQQMIPGSWGGSPSSVAAPTEEHTGVDNNNVKPSLIFPDSGEDYPSLDQVVDSLGDAVAQTSFDSYPDQGDYAEPKNFASLDQSADSFPGNTY